MSQTTDLAWRIEIFGDIQRTGTPWHDWQPWLPSPMTLAEGLIEARRLRQVHPSAVFRVVNIETTHAVLV